MGGKPPRQVIETRIVGRPRRGEGLWPLKSEHNFPPEGRGMQEGRHLLGEAPGLERRGDGSPSLCLVELKFGFGLSNRVEQRERSGFSLPARGPAGG
jgi:hypothetical protein